MVNPFQLWQEPASCTPFGLRELTFLEEQYQQPWAKDLKHLLQEMNATTQRQTFVAYYQELLVYAAFA